MVIMLGIGQSAGLLPTSVSEQSSPTLWGGFVGYGRLSETERQPVNNEGRSIWSWLKIQSGLWGNLEESSDGDEIDVC